MYFKNIENGYIVSISLHRGMIEITEKEYNDIQKIIIERPVSPNGYEYRLKEDLTWELYEITEDEYEKAVEKDESL